jgi:hypothetical protein
MMAGRTPRAARTLIRQVRERLNRKPDSKAGMETAVAVDEPDGLGVHRTFKFDKTASKGLADVLIALDDHRIEMVDEKAGQVVVTFSPGSNADDATDFALDEAAEVVSSLDETAT